MNSKNSNAKSLQKLLEKSKANVCEHWQSIKDNDEEIIYKSKNIDKRYEYFTAKKALIGSADNKLINWVQDYEYSMSKDPEFLIKLGRLFSAEENKEFVDLSNKAVHETDSRGGYYAKISEITLEESSRFKEYESRLETLQTELWEMPYQLLAEHCSHEAESHDDMFNINYEGLVGGGIALHNEL